MSTGQSSVLPSTFMTHLIVGGVGLLAAVPVPGLSPFVWCGMVVMLVAGAAFIVSRFVRARTRNGLAIVENAVVTGEKPPGASEFHQAADNIVTHVSRLAAVAAKGRDQSREVEAVLTAFDRRVSTAGGNANPSRQLTMLLQSLGSDAERYVTRIESLTKSLDTIGQFIVDVQGDQHGHVRSVANEMDLLAQSVETVSSNTKQARTQETQMAEVAESVSGRLLEFQRDLENLRDHVSNSEKKNQLLRELTVEIQSLMRTVNDYSGKTDTMALNASIESVRAGEHGRGFAAAADEIRKLTGIISDSTQSVMERLQVLESGVEDANGICNEEQTAIDTQLNVAREMTQSMAQIRQATNKSREHLEKVLQKAEAQLDNVAAAAQAMESLVTCGERSVKHADEERAQRDDLRKELASLASLIAPLVGKTRSASPAEVQQGAPVVVTSELRETVGSA